MNEEASPKWLSLVSVGYHNLAVLQLKLDSPDLAAKSSQAAKKIARLCLALTNRWLPIYEWTHECALEELNFQLGESLPTFFSFLENTKQFSVLQYKINFQIQHLPLFSCSSKLTSMVYQPTIFRCSTQS